MTHLQKLQELKRLLRQSPNEYPEDLLDEIIAEAEEASVKEYEDVSSRMVFHKIFGK